MHRTSSQAQISVTLITYTNHCISNSLVFSLLDIQSMSIYFNPYPFWRVVYVKKLFTPSAVVCMSTKNSWLLQLLSLILTMLLLISNGAFLLLILTLFRLRDSLLSYNCFEVCMESKGKYWIPIFNVLEKSCHVIIANPKYLRSIKGQKN